MWLKVQAEAGHELKLNWGNSAGPYPLTYSIGAATLRRAADELREGLHALTEWARSGDPHQLPQLLRQLADSGSRLRYVLFDSASEAAKVAELEDWIADEYVAGDTLLWITADPDLHVPWGLVFEGDSNALRDEARSIKDFGGFWSLRYRLSTMFSGCEQPKTKVTRPRDSFRLLSLVNRHEHDNAKSQSGASLHGEFKNFFDIPVGVAYNVQACEQLIEKAAKKDTIFHFFGHGQDGKLDLGNNQKIDVIRFKMMMARLAGLSGDRRVSSCSLVFLNACDSILGESDHSLRTATARPGICGLIATEAIVPRDFAAQFGLSFLQSIVNEGRSIGETMEMLRRDPTLWPLSLLYGCYAYPDYRIAPAPTTANDASLPRLH